MNKKLLAASLAILTIFVFSSCSIFNKPGNGEKYNIYLITMDLEDAHWIKMDEGCRAAVAELGADNIEYTWDAPRGGKDGTQQIECITNAVIFGADLILLAAHDNKAQNGAIEDAIAAGVKIIFVDSPAELDDEAIIQTIKTDNEAAGKTAGEALLAALKANGVEEGPIGIVSPDKGTASTDARAAGFSSAFTDTAFDIMEIRYASGGDSIVAQVEATELITDGAVGLFGANEGTAVGVANAIKDAGGKVLGVGFDTSDTVLAAIEEDVLIGTMAQEPYKMGYMGLTNGYAYLANGTVPANAVEDSGATLVDRSKVGDYK